MGPTYSSVQARVFLIIDCGKSFGTAADPVHNRKLAGGIAPTAAIDN